MYFCKLKIFVLSTDKTAAEKIANMLNCEETLEDCGYQVETASFGDKCDITADCAVIIDTNAEYLLGYKRLGDERVVFLTSAEDMPKTDSKVIAAADEVWVMPVKEHKDESLLNAYFVNMLKSMKKISDSRREKICFNTFIDSMPDMVWFKDNDGAHLIVNNQFCDVVEKTKKQVYKQGHNYIWDVPEEDYETGEAVCRRSEEVVVKARKTCRFEENINTKEGMRQLVTYKSPLIDSDGSVFGTCGLGHDITDLRNMTNELRILIDSIPMGIAIADCDEKVIAINKFFEGFFEDAAESIGQNFDEWSSKLDMEKVNSDNDGDEYRIVLGDKEHVMRFSEEPITDIFDENIGCIHFIRDITIQYKYMRQNVRYANTDFLTGLNNRRSLFNYLEGLDDNSKLSLVAMDLDNFKSVNDTYGHAAGDEALIVVSRILEKCFDDGFAVRLGGDEFLVALVGEHDLPEVEQRAQNLLDTLIGEYSQKEEFKKLSASVGIAQERLTVCDTQSIENLIKRSDDALYTAKKSGKARYCVN
jgi:diguanylate cyclase (GGDEF)-like protein/PAS domain S-box-containing protein